MLRQLYNWTMSFAAHRNARKALAGISFAESSFFPIPPDVLLIPMVLAERRKAFEIAAICTIASVIGGMLGYAIGAFLYDTVGQWVVNLYNLQDKMEAF
jgi:membrane protein YqaA with SNARE-associated domain